MSNTSGSNRHAQAIVEYVEGLLGPGQSMRNFCQSIGFDPERISAWRKSPRDPEISSLQKLGQCLDLSLGQVLVIAGYGTPEELCGATPPARPEPPEPLTVAESVQQSDLPADRKKILFDILAAFDLIDAGAKEANVSSGKVSGRKTRK
jgi:hypothetical protein